MPSIDVAPLDLESVIMRALVASGASRANARPVAESAVAAEAAGAASHGLAYVPTYCEHVRIGKVDGAAVPTLERVKSSLLVADARSGFAHPAIAIGFDALVPLARETGVAALAIRNSYNCGMLSFHTDRLAAAGLIGIGFTNAPASIAPPGGMRPVIGTNPFAIAIPDGRGGLALSIDQSASVVARSEVMKHAREGKPIPAGWALDPEGRPTTDAALALKGTMVPTGGYKGVGIGLMVELLAAAATGATLGIDASPFMAPTGGPPRTGQFFLAIDAGASSAGLFPERIARLSEAFLAQPGVRLPGARRAAARARAAATGRLAVDAELLARIAGLAETAEPA
ncbi:Ldh family oxidoreductase [Labrys wisconsinensis]|uniref:(2R)-3-sulfolactate dehydrogenase (NADP+) n=1 Tax=Labrys wisconsinensis TaxID=425677 RepID=A0ABU0J7P0_9HYPH|nr:Ldh family oxidoreductase [Labrys wisconsinensis]MDQ0469217.1 (2R)-3-sulfolactate dehydrogenase (NADP+) [Labrys wisconsinensis]